MPPPPLLPLPTTTAVAKTLVKLGLCWLNTVLQLAFTNGAVVGGGDREGEPTTSFP